MVGEIRSSEAEMVVQQGPEWWGNASCRTGGVQLPVGRGSAAGSDRRLNTEGGEEGAHHIWGCLGGIEAKPRQGDC